jgi:hypothetical protein
VQLTLPSRPMGSNADWKSPGPGSAGGRHPCWPGFTADNDAQVRAPSQARCRGLARERWASACRPSRSWRSIFCHADKTNAIPVAPALTADPRLGREPGWRRRSISLHATALGNAERRQPWLGHLARASRQSAATLIHRWPRSKDCIVSAMRCVSEPRSAS